MSKFYNFKNITEASAELFIYGDIVSDEGEKWADSDVCVKEFKEELDKVSPGSTLKIYINSGGGSVFAAIAMTNLIRRAKTDNGIKVHAYIDGLAASAASYFPFVADESYLYPTSVLMIHKPSIFCFGSYNATELIKHANTLDKLEEATLIPTYKSRLKDDITEVQLKHMIENETWMSADDVMKNFDGFTLIEEEGPTNNVKSSFFDSYKNVPERFKHAEETKKEETKDVDSEKVDIDNTKDEAQRSDDAKSGVSYRKALNNLYRAKALILTLTKEK